MNLTESEKNELLQLINYAGKKFESWEEIDLNWGLKVNGPMDFPIGNLYAKDFDQAGTEYWFYDGVLSYGMYVWALADGECSSITIRKNKYIRDAESFRPENNSEKLPHEPSGCSRLFSPVFDLSVKEPETEGDLLKEAERLFEGFALFDREKNHEYFFTLKTDVFPEHAAGRCELVFEVWHGRIDAICLISADKAL